MYVCMHAHECMCLCVCVRAHESRCLWRIADGVVFPGAKVISSCVLSIVGAGTHLDLPEEQHLLLN